MATHTKPDGEPVYLFLKRVHAWNDGLPVPVAELTVVWKVAVVSPHRFDSYSSYEYCNHTSCYAKRSKKALASPECPQPIGYIHNRVLRFLLGWAW